MKRHEMMGQELGQVVRQGATLLQDATDTPRLEAEILLAHIAGLSRTALLAHSDRLLPATQQADYLTAIGRRASGYPLPYLTGKVEFYGLEFAVTPDVLIPRPETEVLIDLALARQPQAVVDIGTGSGCIAISLAVHLPEARVYATDLSGPALRVAAANARRHGVQGRIRLIQCDLVDPLLGPFDLVVSNPPYVAQTEWAALPQSVREHEPRLALDGGPDGLKVIRRLLKMAPRVLRPNGTILMEIGAGQGEVVFALARSLLTEAHIVVHKDLTGQDRVVEIWK